MKFRFTLIISSLLLLSQVVHAQPLRIMTYAGSGVRGYGGDGAIATNAAFYGPTSLCIDRSGNVYVVDYFNSRVRRINAHDTITTAAGNGSTGYSGDGSIATSATVNPSAVATDKYGNLYITDGAYTVRKVNSVGIITRIAGFPADSGYTGNGGPALSASFAGPRGIAIDSSGNIFIADAPNNVVRKINGATGVITTVAGNDTAGYLGDGALAIHAELDSPYAVAVDLTGSLFITDYKNNVIRKVDNAGIITTYAGVNPPVRGYTGDNGLATLAELNRPAGIAVDTAGNLYICDANNNVIRKVNKTSKVITTIAGNGTAGFSGDWGYATGANLWSPFGIAVATDGTIYVADAENQRVRKIYNPFLNVNNVFVNTDIDLYPNPAVGQVTLNGLNKADKVSVLDMLGRQIGNVWEITADGTQTFDIRSLSTGVYMLQVTDTDGNKKAVVRFVKE